MNNRNKGTLQSNEIYIFHQHSNTDLNPSIFNHILRINDKNVYHTFSRSHIRIILGFSVREEHSVFVSMQRNVEDTRVLNTRCLSCIMVATCPTYYKPQAIKSKFELLTRKEKIQNNFLNHAMLKNNTEDIRPSTLQAIHSLKMTWYIFPTSANIS